MLDDLTAGKLTGVAAFPLVVGDPFFYRRQLPLIVSEWGGFGFPDYGGPKNDEERAVIIKEFKEELKKGHWLVMYIPRPPILKMKKMAL